MSSIQKIRVRLTGSIAKATVRGFDLKLYEGRRLAASTDKLTEWEITCRKGRVRAISYESGKMLDLQGGVTFESPAGFFNFQNRPYRETLRIYPVTIATSTSSGNSKSSLCEVVNEVDIEKYLDGLVNAEFSARWKEEAVAAQVIAARSYALFQMRQARKNPNSHFDVDATIKDQVYDGSIREDFRASRAVGRTRGMVLSPASGDSQQPMKAFYHSTCGGKTLLPEQVWGGRFPGFKQSVPCPFCVQSPSFRWSVEFSASDIATALLQGALEDGIPQQWTVRGAASHWRQALEKGNLVDLRVSKFNVDGRALEITSVWLIGKESLQLSISASKLRYWIGSTKIKSNHFQVFSQNRFFSRRWKIEGGGYGHGVGMCQWGAKVMGDKGYTVSAILRHYYPDAIIRKLW